MADRNANPFFPHSEFLRHHGFGYFFISVCPVNQAEADWFHSLNPRDVKEQWGVLGKHIGGQLEVFKGVEGDVSVVHHSKDHRDVSALEGQQLDSLQVRHRAVETGARQGGRFNARDTGQQTLNPQSVTLNQ